MKNAMLILALAAAVAGCGGKAPTANGDGADSQLTASDLALLVDFHAWKSSIPETQRPIKAIRLVIVNRQDGTTVTRFGTGDNLGTNCISFLLGIHVRQGEFVGKLFTSNADGGGLGWDLSFTNTLAGWSPAWNAPGKLVWNGNQADLATFTQSNMLEKVLAIELEK